MARTFSQAMVQAVTRIEGEQPIVLSTVDHADLVAPIRVAGVDNTVISRGETYIGMPFRIVLPNFERESPPRAQVVIDNVGRELVEWLELSRGGAGARMTLELVMFDTPDTVEWGATMELRNLSVDTFEVRGELGHDDLVNSPFVRRSFTPRFAPGLF